MAAPCGQLVSKCWPSTTTGALGEVREGKAALGVLLKHVACLISGY